MFACSKQPSGNLGFSLNDEVYVTISERDVVVILRSQGREVSFRAGGGECDSQKMAMFWQRLISQWNTGGSLSETDRDEIYRSSKASRLVPVILGKLLDHGFQIDTEKAHIDLARILQNS